MSDFVKFGFPEAQDLGICMIVRDLAFGRGPGPWRGALDPKIEVSGRKNKNIFNHMLGLHQHSVKYHKGRTLIEVQLEEGTPL